VNILLVCFANICRSPAAAALFDRESGGTIDAISRGVAGGPDEMPVALESALATAELTVARPVGVALAPSDVDSADLCLFMGRQLLREVVVADPRCWPRSFTMREFVRRALANPPGASDESFEMWRARLHAGRKSDELLGVDDEDEVRDPGLRADQAAYDDMIASLADMIGTVTPFLTSWTSRSAS
jgi:protein-tyrosine phosphatase